VIGMTNMPEAKLAREAELCFASVAMVTDYDCWHDEMGHVEVAGIVRLLAENADRARALVATAARGLAPRPVPCPHGCDRALDTAIITAPEARDPALARRLAVVAGRVLGARAGA
jgi:5'-methylthioadenosine phosphorylase